MPFQQKADRPRVEGGIIVIVNHVGIFPLQVLITRHHVEIRAGEITLILVVRFEHLRGTTPLPQHGISHLRDSVVEFRGLHLAQRVIAFGHIGCCLRRIKMVEVDIGRRGGRAAPPAFRKRMLAVKPPETVTHIQGYVAIHIPPFAISSVILGIHIGAAEIIGKGVIG